MIEQANAIHLPARGLDHREPAVPVRILVDHLGVRVERGVGLDDGGRNGQWQTEVHLDRLQRRELVARRDCRPRRFHGSERQVAAMLLDEIGDADPDATVAESWSQIPSGE